MLLLEPRKETKHLNYFYSNTKKQRLPTGRGGDYYDPVTPKVPSIGNPQRTAPSETTAKPSATPNNPPTTKSTTTLPTSRGGDYYNPTPSKNTTVPNPQRPSSTSRENAQSNSPSASDRIWDTITGSTKQSVGNFGSGVSAFVQTSQSNLLREDEIKYDLESK